MSLEDSGHPSIGSSDDTAASLNVADGTFEDSGDNTPDSSQGSQASTPRTPMSVNQHVKAGDDLSSGDDTFDTEASGPPPPVASPMGKANTQSTGSFDATTAAMGLQQKRPRTLMGPQGEHVSAYTLYEELIYEAVWGRTVAESPHAIQSVLEAILPNLEKDKEFSELMEKVKADMVDSISRDERKKITRSLRGIIILEPHIKRLIELVRKEKIEDAEEAIAGLERLSAFQDYYKVREAIRVANRAVIASTVVQLLNKAILSANKMPYVSYPKEGNEINRFTGREREAKGDLRILSTFIEALQEAKRTIPKQKRSINIFVDENLPAQLEKKWGIERGQIEGLLQEKTTIERVLAANKSVSKIVERISWLFFYPKISEQRLLEPDGDEWQQHANSYNKGTVPRDNDSEKLYFVVGRHLVLIFNSFTGLKELSTGLQSNLVRQFLEKALEQGWGDTKTTYETLKKGLEKYVQLDFDSKHYYVSQIPVVEKQLKVSRPRK